MGSDIDTGADDEAATLDARVAALEDAVDDLRAATATRRTAPRGPPGPVPFPRPPTPREFLAFAVDDAIPATVALLDAQIRALEALRAALRLVDAGRGRAVPDDTVGREALDRLDGALSDLRAAVSGDALSENDAARDILADARALTADLEARVDAAREERETRAESEARDVAVEDAAERDDDHERRAERVEDELDQLRDEYDDPDEDGDV